MAERSIRGGGNVERGRGKEKTTKGYQAVRGRGRRTRGERWAKVDTFM